MRLVILCLLASATLSAADVSGLWTGTSEPTGRRNQVQDIAFQFVQKGSAITGKLYLDNGSTPILKGTVDGDQISFEVVAREQNGNEINTAVLRFTGTLKDGDIEINRERQEVHNAGNAGASVNRPGKQVFHLKRLP